MSRIGVVAFAFGKTNTGDVLPINWRIAQANRNDMFPLFTQEDIPSSEFEAVVLKDEDGNPPPTLRIARSAAQWAYEKELDTLLVVCARPHSWRCLRDMRKALRETNSEEVEVKLHPKVKYLAVAFDKNSAQQWTRSFWQWWARELLLRLMPFWLYRRIAS